MNKLSFEPDISRVIILTPIGWNALHDLLLWCKRSPYVPVLRAIAILMNEYEIHKVSYLHELLFSANGP